MDKIKTIIFDLGGVYFTDGTKQAIQKIGEKFHKDEETVARIFNGELGTKYRKGEISFSEFWNEAISTLNITATVEEMAEIWHKGNQPIRGTVNIIEQLKKQNYELLFLSDNVQERVDYIERNYHFLKNFKDGVFSHKAGTRKPDPKMYELALQLTESNPHECIYIDDKIELLAPAEKLGMKTIHFTHPQALPEKLNGFGVIIKNRQLNPNQ